MATLTRDIPVTVGRDAGAGLLLAIVSAATFGMSGALARPLLDSGWTAGGVVLSWAGRPGGGVSHVDRTAEFDRHDANSPCRRPIWLENSILPSSRHGTVDLAQPDAARAVTGD